MYKLFGKKRDRLARIFITILVTLITVSMVLGYFALLL